MKIREKKYLLDGLVGMFAIFGFGIALGFSIGWWIGLNTGLQYSFLAEIGYGKL